MSAKATAWAWDQAMKSHSAKLVLLCLADSHDACSGRVDTDLAHITRMTGLATTTVRSALAGLQKRGLVVATAHSVSPPGFNLEMVGPAA
jgi:pyocin large subunit-like protein